jgi:hypothetical protein
VATAVAALVGLAVAVKVGELVPVTASVAEVVGLAEAVAV